MVGHSKERRGIQTHTHADIRGPSRSVYHHFCASKSSAPDITRHRSLEKWSEPKWKGSVCLCWPIPWCLTTGTGHPKSCHGAVIPYLTVKALAAASALPRLGPGPSLKNACAVEELQSQGLESEQSLLVKVNCSVMSHSISSSSLRWLLPVHSFTVSHCRCKWVWGGSMRREGPLHKQLWLLYLPMPQRL